MAIRWEQIQNLTVTEAEINLLSGLTASASELNEIADFTGTSTDLNNLLGLDVTVSNHMAQNFSTAHPIAAGSLDGLVITDNTIVLSKLAFDVATQVELDATKTDLTNLTSDVAVQQDQIDNLYAIVIPGQGNDLADSIQQTINHIEDTTNAHNASAVSFGPYYSLPSDITAGVTTSLTIPSNLIKYFRVGEDIRFQDDVTATEDVTLTSVNYTTGVITFLAPVNGYTTADNGIIFVLSEMEVQSALEKAFRNDGETELVIREGVYSLTLTPDTLTSNRNYTLRDEDLILGNPSLTGNGLSVLRVNAGATDVEWHDLAAEDIDYDNILSGLAALNVKDALDEIDSDLDTHIADGSIHFTEGSISHLSIQDIGTTSHADIDLHIGDTGIHFIIDDTGTAIDEAWSSNKISSELSTKSDTSHNHTLDSLSNVDATGKASGSILEWDGVGDWIVGTKGEINTASNLGSGDGVFAAKAGLDLQFKSLIAGSNISLTPAANDITIAATGVGEVNTASNVGGELEVFKQKSGVDFQFRTLKEGSNISITQNADDLEIAVTGVGAGGTSIERNQVAHGFVALDAIYHNGTIWAKAQADDPETLAEYIVTEVVDVDNFTAFKFGGVTIPGHGKTVGEYYFLSDLVAGGHQLTEPSQFSCPLFYVESSSLILVGVHRPSEVSEVTEDLEEQYNLTVTGTGWTTVRAVGIPYRVKQSGVDVWRLRFNIDGSYLGASVDNNTGGLSVTGIVFEASARQHVGVTHIDVQAVSMPGLGAYAIENTNLIGVIWNGSVDFNGQWVLSGDVELDSPPSFL